MHDESDETQQAAAEAARIGGVAGDEDLDPERRAPIEGGGGEAEGFEGSEELLIEHASHSDEQSAHTVLHDQGASEEEDPSREDGEGGHELSSELEE